MDILSKARKLESTLARTVDRAAQQWSRSGPQGPLEVLHAILEAVGDRVEPAGRGKHVFPFNKIKVSIAAVSLEARARFAGVLDGTPTLQERICNRLREAGCNVPGLNVRIAYVAQPQSAWATPDFHLDFLRTSVAELLPSEPTATHEIKLTITLGFADKGTYVLARDRINIGRSAEVRDSRNRLIRTNHVVFGEGAGPTNETVSRRHAHIHYDESTGGYRIADDRSAHGTSVVRNGKTVSVPTGSRGIRLHSGDEVVLGEARLRVKVSDSAKRT
jgi:hypothetical protein